MSRSTDAGGQGADSIRLTTLQAGRGIAAMLVVLYHACTVTFPAPKYWGLDPTYNLFAFGHAGVEFFFVLSGFIILHVHWNDLGQRRRLAGFVQKRWARIYPIYWVILAGLVPIYYLMPSFGEGHEREPGLLLSSALLIHGTSDKTLLSVAWTLYHEVLFYAVFAIGIWHRRFGAVAMAFFLGFSALGLLLPGRSYPLAFYASPLHLLFGLGMLACILLRLRKIRQAWAWLVAGLTLFLGTAVIENLDLGWLSSDARHLLYGIGCTAAVCGAVQLERDGRLRAGRWLCFLGDASYSLYLIHFPLLSLAAKVLIATPLQPGASLIMMLAAVTAAGCLFHVLVERPLVQWTQRRFRARH
jgi:exopolysaccharide production protein ExoZ